MKAAETHSSGTSPSSTTSEEIRWEGHIADDVAATYGPEPLAMLTVMADGLNLTSTRGNYRLPKAAVTKLGRGTFYPWLFSAVRIHHNIAGYPKNLQFKPHRLKPRELLEQLRTLGYPVA